MSKYFFTHTCLSVIEREMVKIPGFDREPPSTTYIFPITCEECRFRDIPTSCHDAPKDTDSSCPFLLKRILAGDIDRIHTLHQARYGTVLLPKTLFFHRKHRAFYHSLRHSIPYNANNQKAVAVLYLMSYHDALYDCFAGESIATALTNMSLSWLDAESYSVLCLAKDIYCSTHYIDPEDFSCPDILSHQTVALTYGALLILRYGTARSSALRKCL